VLHKGYVAVGNYHMALGRLLEPLLGHVGPPAPRQAAGGKCLASGHCHQTATAPAIESHSPAAINQLICHYGAVTRAFSLVTSSSRQTGVLGSVPGQPRLVHCAATPPAMQRLSLAVSSIVELHPGEAGRQAGRQAGRRADVKRRPRCGVL
jgi:hypothetical protein